MALVNKSAHIFRRFATKIFENQVQFFKKRKNLQNMYPSVNYCTKTDEGDTTMQQVKIELAKSMGIVAGFRLYEESREHLLKYLPASQDELEPRSMQDSFSSAILPLSTNAYLQDKYVSFLGSVRFGRLLEDMDIFAVWVVNKHIKNHKQPLDKPCPYTIVTLMVDKIDFTDVKPLHNEDIRLSGHVSWVGKSSIEVVVWLEQHRHKIWQKLTRASFLMAVRNSTNQKAAFINPIKPANEREEIIFKNGEVRTINRKLLQNKSLQKMIPTEEEQMIMHDLYMRTMPLHEISLAKRSLPDRCVWMENATMSNIIFSHPENRNLHNKVFGGFIMRMACELSWSLGYMFSKYHPELKHISDIRFYKPIKVNSLIKMQAYVVFTQNQFMQIIVYAESFETSNQVHNTTNVFHFTYQLPGYIPEVVPQTYHEAMMYLDGRRHFYNAVHKSNILEDTGIQAKL